MWTATSRVSDCYSAIANFDHYLDDGIFYERRPSVWVEPLDPWGEGAVQLVEIQAIDETFDNIVAYWAPKEEFKSGDRRTWRYRLSWLDEIPFPDAVARAIGTWTGLGGRPGASHERPAGVRKFVIDFQGKVFEGLGRNDGVELIVNVSRGTLSGVYNYPVVDQKQRWRAMFDIKASGDRAGGSQGFPSQGQAGADRDLDLPVFPRPDVTS